MKILIATFSLVTLALLVAPTGRAQFVPDPNPIAGNVTPHKLSTAARA